MTSLHYSEHSGLRRMATLFFLSLVLVAIGSVSAFAQNECQPGACPGIRVFNCTDDAYQISFLLCCNGQIVQTPYAAIPPTNCPDGPPSFARLFPEGCTLIGIADINPQPPANVDFNFNGDNCRLVIRYE